MRYIPVFVGNQIRLHGPVHSEVTKLGNIVCKPGKLTNLQETKEAFFFVIMLLKMSVVSRQRSKI
jgi:hypothetical protein